MAKNRSIATHTQHQQKGPRYEGHPLSVLKMPAGLGSSEDVITVGLDISSAPVPQGRFAAELCEVRFEFNDLRLIFAQRTLDRGGLDSALIVRMNPIAGHQLLRSINDMQRPGLDGIAEAMGIQATPLAKISQQPSQMANVVANLVAIAVSGFETCMDFYHASAFAMRNVTDSDTLAVEPIVRVDVQTAVFVSMVQELRALESVMPPEPQRSRNV